MTAPRRQVVLLLPGQGAQAERMGAGLLGCRPFADSVEEVLDPLDAIGAQLRAAWLAPTPNLALDAATVAQPLLLTIGWALGRTLAALGCPPDVLLGHSVGELTAACLAGVVDRSAVPAVVAVRAQNLAGGEGSGGMLAVLATSEEVQTYVSDEVCVAAVNGPRQLILAGPAAALSRTAEQLRGAGRLVRPLRSSHPFHSPGMADEANRTAQALGQLCLRPPATPIMSTRTAAFVTPEDAVDPRFWADQLVLPVRYWPAVSALLDERGEQPGLDLLDASPDQSLSAPLRHHRAVRAGASRVLPLLDPLRRGEDCAALERALATCHRTG